MGLPLLPHQRLVIESVETNPSAAGFLNLKRVRCHVEGKGGQVSTTFSYDLVERSRLDAVVIVPHFVDSSRTKHVYLRSALRPPAALRPAEHRLASERDSLGSMWEVPAGLVEEDERSLEGLKACASRELAEEIGFTLPPHQFIPLGPSLYPAPAVLGERLHFFQVEVDPAQKAHPSTDGSVLEEVACIVTVTLNEALALVRAGEIEDMKSEIALRRLSEL